MTPNSTNTADWKTKLSKITQRIFDIQVEGYDGGEQLELVEMYVRQETENLIEELLEENKK